METCKLLPITKRLKQLRSEFGPTWFVVQARDSLPCFNGRPGLFIKSLNGKHSRWVMSDQVEEHPQ